jgi:hypothetical protein
MKAVPDTAALLIVVPSVGPGSRGHGMNASRFGLPASLSLVNAAFDQGCWRRRPRSSTAAAAAGSSSFAPIARAPSSPRTAISLKWKSATSASSHSAAQSARRSRRHHHRFPDRPSSIVAPRTGNDCPEPEITKKNRRRRRRRPHHRIVRPAAAAPLEQVEQIGRHRAGRPRARACPQRAWSTPGPC